MALPTTSVRARPEHHKLLRVLARALDADPSLAAKIEGLTQGGGAARTGTVGPFVSESAAVAFLRERLVAALNPVAIWLFGSRGRGDSRADSDFDLLVVLPDGAGDEADDYRRAYDPVAGAGLAVDVVPCRESDFAAERDVPGTLPHAAVTEGRLLYRKDAAP